MLRYHATPTTKPALALTSAVTDSPRSPAFETVFLPGFSARRWMTYRASIVATRHIQVAARYEQTLFIPGASQTFPDQEVRGQLLRRGAIRHQQMAADYLRPVLLAGWMLDAVPSNKVAIPDDAPSSTAPPFLP